MKRIMKGLLPFFLVTVHCLFCYGETKDDIVELYSRYRELRSQAQLMYICSPSSKPVITEGMKQFYLNGKVDTLMFHAYEPKSFVVKDDFEFLGLDENDSYQEENGAIRNYFLITNETVIEEIYGEERCARNMKMREVIWIQEVDGNLYILGDPSLSNYYVRISDLQRQ